MSRSTDDSKRTTPEPDDWRKGPPRIVINLRLLPLWLQYVIALVVVAGVLILVWHTRAERPVPNWFSHYVLPAIQWGGGAILILVLAYGAVRWLGQGRKKS